MLNPFDFAATPHIHFGVGTRSTLTAIIQTYGNKVLLITGGKSFDDSELCLNLLSELEEKLEVHRKKQWVNLHRRWWMPGFKFIKKNKKKVQRKESIKEKSELEIESLPNNEDSIADEAGFENVSKILPEEELENE